MSKPAIESIAPPKTSQGREAGKRGAAPLDLHRRQPVGAEVLPGGGVHFRVWAPRRQAVAVRWWRPATSSESSDRGTQLDLAPEPGGYFSAYAADAEAGMLYQFVLGDGAFPDPASRFQPNGPHGPSQIIDPKTFPWTDAGWKGVSVERAVIYEMHVGTFTSEGTWRAAADQLPALAELGVTLIEVMPVADFPGRFGWGYDGVNLFAPTRLYGTPDELRAFVNRAHGCGIGVILDVVYNHLGPDGNYLDQFSEHYFTDRYQNEWGRAINFDDEESGPVREFFIANAKYWIDEFHLDGLRLDATQQIFDVSADNIMAAITRAVRSAAGERVTYVVAENEPQHIKLVRPPEKGGYGMDALWNDDFHHAAQVALTGRREAYYVDYRGTPQEFISAIKWGYLYQGQRYKWQKQRRGTPTIGLSPTNFVIFLQNHDQVANSLRGHRAHLLTSPGRLRALTALLLLSPNTPMLFQGQEFAASAPFLYFADHNPDLAKQVAAGRRAFLSQFQSVNCQEAEGLICDPESEETFRRCKLDLSERDTHAHILLLHRDLLKLRREDPVFSRPRSSRIDGAVLGIEAFVLRYFAPDGEDRLLLVNLGQELHLDPAPEPLLAPVEGCLWETYWSSETPCYGGAATPPLDTEENWRLPPHSSVVLRPNRNLESEHG